MTEVFSYADFIQKAQNLKKAFLLLHKNESEKSRCALQNIESTLGKINPGWAFIANVERAKDIHPAFQINSVPSLLVFENGKYTNLVQGCQDVSFYETLVGNNTFGKHSDKTNKAIPRVTVYSTPTCSWCNTLKTWLKNNQVLFSDIDVSRNEKAADEMVKRSGQHGVPQTDINGQIVIGFDQKRLKELLNIR